MRYPHLWADLLPASGTEFTDDTNLPPSKHQSIAPPPRETAIEPGQWEGSCFMPIFHCSKFQDSQWFPTSRFQCAGPLHAADITSDPYTPLVLSLEGADGRLLRRQLPSRSTSMDL